MGVEQDSRSTFERLQSYLGRISLAAKCYDELAANPGDERARELATQVKILSLAMSESKMENEAKKLLAIEAGLEKTQADRASMEAGVTRADQAPRLPRARGTESHGGEQ